MQYFRLAIILIFIVLILVPGTTNAAPGILPGFQNIEWLATKDEVRNAMEKKGYERKFTSGEFYKTTFAGYNAYLKYYYMKADKKVKNPDEMWMTAAAISIPANNNTYINKYNDLYLLLEEKYGPPDVIKGNDINREVIWYFGTKLSPDESDYIWLRIAANPIFENRHKFYQRDEFTDSPLMVYIKYSSIFDSLRIDLVKDDRTKDI